MHDAEWRLTDDVAALEPIVNFRLRQQVKSLHAPYSLQCLEKWLLSASGAEDGISLSVANTQFLLYLN